MEDTILLAKRPDLVLKLEKYNLLPKGNYAGSHAGCAKQWARERIPPYDRPDYQAMAERLPTGWEEISRKEWEDLLGKVQQAIRSQKKAHLDTQGKGSEQLLAYLSKIAVLGVAIAGSLLVENGLGLIPDKDEKDAEKAQALSFELVLHFIQGTGFLDTLFRKIAAAAETTQENQAWIAEALLQTALILTILVASNGKEDRLKELLVSFKSRLSQGLHSVKQFIDAGVQKSSIDTEQAVHADLYLQQARIALDREDFDGFYEALVGSLAMIEMIPDELLLNIREIRELAGTLKELIETALIDSANQLTAISQSM